MNPRVWTVAAHEYVTNVRRKEFILITLGLPVIFLVIGTISVLGTTAATGMFSKKSQAAIGIVDDSGLLDLKATDDSDQSRTIVPYKDAGAGKRDVRDGVLADLVLVSRDYLTSGTVTVYRKRGGLFSDNGPHVGDLLARALLARSHIDKRVVDRAVAPVGGDSQTFTLEKSRFVKQDTARQAARFIVPYVFTILLTSSIFIGSSYLLRSVSEEKENRVIEVILSSVTADDLLKGKLIGLSGVGLTQVTIWVTMAAAPAAALFSRVVHISAASIAEAVLFFVLGFGLYATIMAGIGALGTSMRESQQISGMISMGAVLPYFFMPLLLEAPNGTFARVLSFIPFSAPTTMVIRATASDVSALDIALSAGILAVTIWLLVRLSAKLFRFGLLIYGKRPSFTETVRWLRAS